MKRSSAILMLVVVAALAVGLAAEAQAADRVAESRVKFEKLIEKKVGETEYLGIVVRPLDGGGSATLLLGRKHRLAAAVRKLKKGVVIAVRYGAEGGHNWLTRMEVVGEDERRREGDRERKREGDRERKREGDRERKREGDRRREGEGRREGERARGREGGDREIVVMLRRLLDRLERLEKQVRELRAENAQLRKRLGMKGEGDRERKREDDRERKREGDRERKREGDRRRDGDREKAGPKDDDREG